MEIQIPLVIFTSFLAWAAGIFGTQCILALQKRGGAVQLPALICSAVVLVVGGIAVNVFFTFPYWTFNLTITGYPLSFLTFLSVSVITSALTTKTRQLDKLRMENEKIRMRAALLRSVSHDIRTPLTSIIGSTSAVLDHPDLSQEDRRSLLEDVKQEAQWLIRIVENLLSITRIGGDEAKVNKTPEAAEEIIEGAVGKFTSRWGTDIPVEVHLPEEFLLVPMDPLLMEQVLTNLMENAVLHAEGATEIELRIRREGDLAQFSVLDNGAGIEPAVLPKLFEEMFPHAGELRGDGRRSMGIGLSVCMSIVRAHGGTMKAKNRATGGACVSFVLPMGEE